jgi:hypothetical protein
MDLPSTIHRTLDEVRHGISLGGHYRDMDLDQRPYHGRTEQLRYREQVGQGGGEGHQAPTRAGGTTVKHRQAASEREAASGE